MKKIFLLLSVLSLQLQAQTDFLRQIKIGNTTTGLSILKGINTAPGLVVPSGAFQILRVNAANDNFEFVAPPWGTGTVTSIAFTTSNGIGVSGSPISTSGVIGLSLGVITPTSVISTGPVSGTNLSGTNTGDNIFNTNDFNTSGANVTLDYTNSQAATSGQNGFLSATDWSTFNGKISASSSDVLTNKSIDATQLTGTAYTIPANNTNSTAAYTLQAYQDVPVANYVVGTTGNITWDGSVAPSSATSIQYAWSRIGNTVTLVFGAVYSSSGTGNTLVNVDLPIDCPAPINIAGLGSNANEKICFGTGSLETNPTSVPSTARCWLSRNSAGTGYAINIKSATASVKVAQFTISYRVN